MRNKEYRNSFMKLMFRKRSTARSLMDGIAAYLKSKLNCNLAEPEAETEAEAEAESEAVRKTPPKLCVKLIPLV